MTPISTEIHVWFLRHGRTPFDYENSKYDDFIQMLCNGHETPLAKDPGIDFNLLPKQVDYIGYSPIQRAVETAKILYNRLGVNQMEELKFLREVKFDKDIVLEHEFESLKQIRPKILRRWYNNENKAESFEDSLTRLKKIESFLNERQEKAIILVTHGWFLRLLNVYFVQGKHHTPTIDELLEVKPVPLGHWIKATVARKSRAESQMDLVGGRYSRQSRVHAR